MAECEAIEKIAVAGFTKFKTMPSWPLTGDVPMKNNARGENCGGRENCEGRAWLISALANFKIITVTYSMDNFENGLPDFFGEVSRLGVGLECLNKLMQGSDQ